LVILVLTVTPVNVSDPLSLTTLFRSKQFLIVLLAASLSAVLSIWGYKQFEQQQSAAQTVVAPAFQVTGQIESQLEALYRSRLRSDRKSTRLNSSHVKISYAVFCVKKE